MHWTRTLAEGGAIATHCLPLRALPPLPPRLLAWDTDSAIAPHCLPSRALPPLPPCVLAWDTGGALTGGGRKDGGQ